MNYQLAVLVHHHFVVGAGGGIREPFQPLQRREVIEGEVHFHEQAFGHRQRLVNQQSEHGIVPLWPHQFRHMGCVREEQFYREV